MLLYGDIFDAALWLHLVGMTGPFSSHARHWRLQLVSTAAQEIRRLQHILARHIKENAGKR